jgi:hypothetical protein
MLRAQLQFEMPFICHRFRSPRAAPFSLLTAMTAANRIRRFLGFYFRRATNVRRAGAYRACNLPPHCTLLVSLLLLQRSHGFAANADGSKDVQWKWQGGGRYSLSMARPRDEVRSCMRV